MTAAWWVATVFIGLLVLGDALLYVDVRARIRALENPPTYVAQWAAKRDRSDPIPDNWTSSLVDGYWLDVEWAPEYSAYRFRIRNQSRGTLEQVLLPRSDMTGLAHWLRLQMARQLLSETPGPNRPGGETATTPPEEQR